MEGRKISSPGRTKKRIISPTPNIEPNGRPTKLEYYIGVAKSVSERSPCARRKFGAIIVKNDKIVSCYDDQTEILTENGWKLFRDLGKSETVATLNQFDELEYQLPTNWFEENYYGKMYHIHTQLIDFCVTPGHFMYVSKAYMKGKKRLYRDFKRIIAYKVYGKRIKYKRNCNWSGIRKEVFILPEYVPKHSNQWDHSSVEIPMDLWLEFLGYYLAEGCVIDYGRLSRTMICTDNKDRFRNDMVICCKKMAHILGRAIHFDKRGRIIIDDERLYRYLKPLGKCLFKYIPREFLTLCREQLLILLEALVKGDGAFDSPGARYFSSSKKLINDFHELMFKCGYVGTEGYRIQKEPVVIDGRSIFTRNKNWVVSFSNSRLTTGVYKNISWKDTKNIEEWLDYSGKVYCVEVPNHIIYVRRNGRAAWCGNTGYNGSARGTYNCGTEIPCLKDLHGETPYTSYSHCSSLHAEDNAISSAGWDSCFGAVMYLAPSMGQGDLPCFRCRRKIINAQLEGVWYVAQDGTFKYASWEDLVELGKGWQEGQME